MPPFTTGIVEAPADSDEDAKEARSTPYFTEFCSARSLKKASSFRPVTPSVGDGSGIEKVIRAGRGGDDEIYLANP